MCKPFIRERSSENETMIGVLFDSLRSLPANKFKCYEDRPTRSNQASLSYASIQALMVGIPAAWSPELPHTAGRHSTLLYPKLGTKSNKQKQGRQGTPHSTPADRHSSHADSHG
jgi:hypothetical protein